jgi:hypothetical protein
MTITKLGNITVENMEGSKRPTVLVHGKEAVALTFIKAKEKMDASKEAYDDQREVITYEAEEIQKQLCDKGKDKPENINFRAKNGTQVNVISTYSSKEISKEMATEIESSLPKAIVERLVEREYSITIKGKLARKVVKHLNDTFPALEDSNIRHDKNFSEKESIRLTKEAHSVIQEIRKEFPAAKEILNTISETTTPTMTVKVTE